MKVENAWWRWYEQTNNNNHNSCAKHWIGTTRWMSGYSMEEGRTKWKHVWSAAHTTTTFLPKNFLRFSPHSALEFVVCWVETWLPGKNHRERHYYITIIIFYFGTVPAEKNKRRASSSALFSWTSTMWLYPRSE